MNIIVQSMGLCSLSASVGSPPQFEVNEHVLDHDNYSVRSMRTTRATRTATMGMWQVLP